MLFQHAPNTMRKRKLQVFLSSTYEDLIDERLAAIEAILAAGHIPAAMEQFSPGDDTAWERIRVRIDESDAFILILGGRYGSIEPGSGKSYVQLEYEYAIEKKKPFFALVISPQHHERRVQAMGLNKVDERDHAAQYREFKATVLKRLCGFWNDIKDIESRIFHKLPEWAQRDDLIGWIRADEVPRSEVTNELARLSQENRELREQVREQPDDFDGFTFRELCQLLRESPLSEAAAKAILASVGPIQALVRDSDAKGALRHHGVLADLVLKAISETGRLTVGIGQESGGRAAAMIDKLLSFGLLQVHREGNARTYTLSETGRRFRAQLWRAGDTQYRMRELWQVNVDTGDLQSSVAPEA